MIDNVEDAVKKLNEVRFLDRTDWGWCSIFGSYGVQAGIAGPGFEREAAIRIARSYELEEENVRLRDQVASCNLLHLDKPEDRLWHDSDESWWFRDWSRGGRLFAAEPPLAVQRLVREIDRLIRMIPDEQDAYAVQKRTQRRIESGK